MPVIGKQDAQDQLGDFLEDLLEKLDEIAAARQEVIVQVPEGQPPVVNVAASQRVHAWRFKVTRGSDGLIDYVDAFPKL